MKKMIRTKPECKIKFENEKEKIRTIFSTSYILKCHSSGDYEIYEEIFESSKIKKMLEDSELIFTAEQFLANSLNLTHAGRSAFMHRNTMIYRIKKIGKITGLNLKLFTDAQIFSNMLEVYKIIQEKQTEEQEYLMY